MIFIVRLGIFYVEAFHVMRELCGGFVVVAKLTSKLLSKHMNV